MNTGDIGFIDKNGELHIVGRQDDVVIIDAHKIYPNEVEKQILKISSVAECAVAGIQENGHSYIGCLCVGAAFQIDIRKWLSEYLPTRLRYFRTGMWLSTEHMRSCMPKAASIQRCSINK